MSAKRTDDNPRPNFGLIFFTTLFLIVIIIGIVVIAIAIANGLGL